ncbi:antitoxin ParD1/3/4 [Rhizobiales bacterium GAS188]|nr:antitoxin ParD1/3/4 [Rhizobiales bacterium GAS188]
MSNVQKVSVALTPEIVAMPKDAVETGEYTSTSEVVREALRAWKMRRTVHEMEIGELRKLWNEGVASGPPIDAESVFRRLRDKYAEQAASEPSCYQPRPDCGRTVRD